MSETYRISENGRAELFSALAAAQKVMTGASKDVMNPHFQHKYADLASVWDACRAPLSDNGLSILQPVSCDGGKVTVTTILCHVSGAWIASDLTMTTEKQTPQGIGSCITYGRRYGLSAMVGISPEDDDGNLASGGSKEAAQKVADRKIADKSKPAAKSEPSKNFKFLGAMAEMKTAIGEKLYYGVLRAAGFAKSTEIAEREDEVKVYKAMGEVKKQIDSAAEGVLAGPMSEAVFAAMPENHLARAFQSMQLRFQQAMGDDAGIAEYDSIRAKSASQWVAFASMASAIDELQRQQ